MSAAIRAAVNSAYGRPRRLRFAHLLLPLHVLDLVDLQALGLERPVREQRPEGFRLHDLRHYYASLLIASGLDVKTVSALVRHANAASP